MLVQIANVLPSEELAKMRERLGRATWVDGRATAGPQSAQVKQNLQLPEDGDHARELGTIIIRALERNASFMSAALPRHVFPPLFNRYEPGMGFGPHVDNAIRQVGQTPLRMRTDISATLFLCDEAEYDGGELIVEDTYGTHRVKLPAGDMILYPATSLHRVAPVVRGTRVAAFFWIQSMVKDDAARNLLFDMDRSILELAQTSPSAPALLRLTACYHNLIRRWAEM
jgi:PKHD-type hydroxylase